MPHKRHLVASAVALGSGGLAVVRWLTGHWLPSIYLLLHSKWFLAYLGASGFVGAAVTYVYGGTDNPRINTVVQAGLQLGGVLLLAYGTWTQVGVTAVAVVALLLGHYVVPRVAR